MLFLIIWIFLNRDHGSPIILTIRQLNKKQNKKNNNKQTSNLLEVLTKCLIYKMPIYKCIKML